MQAQGIFTYLQSVVQPKPVLPIDIAVHIYADTIRYGGASLTFGEAATPLRSKQSASGSISR